MARDIYAGEGDLDMARRQARKSTLHLVFAPTSGRQQAVPYGPMKLTKGFRKIG